MSDGTPSWSETIAAFVAAESNQEDVITMCSLLANRRRQYVVLYMLTRDSKEWVSMRELARWITAVMHEYSIQDATGNDYRNIRESLRNTHLETLAEADIITYDAQQTRVAPGDRLQAMGRIFFHLLLLTAEFNRERS